MAREKFSNGTIGDRVNRGAARPHYVDSLVTMAMVKLVERIVQLEWFQKIEWLADIELWDIARQQKTRKKRAEAKQSDVHFLHDAVIDSHSRDCSAVPRATTAVANGTAADSLSEPSPLF